LTGLLDKLLTNELAVSQVKEHVGQVSSQTGQLAESEFIKIGELLQHYICTLA